MSSGQIVRKPLRLHEQASRALDQRLALRLPWLPNLGARLIGSLRPTSRLRQAVIWRAVRQAADAFNRRDFEAVRIGHRRDIEYLPPHELVEWGGMKASYRGHEGHLQFVNEWLTAWGSFRGEPLELIDLGDRLLLLGRVAGLGRDSGVPISQLYAVLVSFKNGRVIREQYYADHTEALEAAGLPAPLRSTTCSEQALEPHRRNPPGAARLPEERERVRHVGPSASCGIVPRMTDEARLDKLALRSPAAAFFLFGTSGLDWFFLTLLKRDTTIQIRAEHLDYTTTTEILATAPDGEGGLALMLDSTIDHGELVVTAAMMAGAEYDGDSWYIRHGGLMFRFGARFGARFFTEHPEAREEHRRYTEEREVRPEAQPSEQEGRWLGFGIHASDH